MPKVQKVMTAGLTIRAAAVDATEAVREMQKLHGSYPVPTVAVGRTMVGALLMASQAKQNQEVAVYLRGNGPLESVFAEATFEGAVRGYTPNPHLDLAPVDGQLRVGPAIGIGLLTVVQSSPYSRQPHRGTVELITGEVGDDLAYYFQQSLQIPSVVALGVKLDTYGHVLAAGGVLIEVMPGVTEQELAQLEASAKKVSGLSDLLAGGATTNDLLKLFLSPFELILLEHDHPVRYECRCSKDRVERALLALGTEEMDSMIADGKPVEMVCEFCGKKYILPLDEVGELRAKSYKASLH